MDFTKVPGLDVLSIQTIISETGINHNKWLTEKHFSSWLGLSPANKITGEKVIGTRTRKIINRAAHAFRLAAHCISKSKSALGAYCRRLKKMTRSTKSNYCYSKEASMYILQYVKVWTRICGKRNGIL